VTLIRRQQRSVKCAGFVQVQQGAIEELSEEELLVVLGGTVLTRF